MNDFGVIKFLIFSLFLRHLGLDHAMILSIDSNAAYLASPKAQSRAGGFYYMGNRNKELINSPVAVNAKII